MEKFGFIGMGNMAKALAGGFIGKNTLKKEDIFAYAPNQEKLNNNAKEIGFTPEKTIEDLFSDCDTFVMACKPYQIERILEEHASAFEGRVLLSVAAGWDHAKYKEFLPNTRIQFIMPNTPAMAGEGVFLFEETGSLTAEELDQAKKLFASLGMVETLPSHLMGIGGAVSGCGPAFVDLFMESYADAAVKYGIPRETAYRLVAQTMLGSAKLQMETGTHPGKLKDDVCSPGGTTIRGVGALEEKGFRHACISSIDAIMDMKKGK